MTRRLAGRPGPSSRSTGSNFRNGAARSFRVQLKDAVRETTSEGRRLPTNGASCAEFDRSEQSEFSMSVRRHVRHAVGLIPILGLLLLPAGNCLADGAVPAVGVAQKDATSVVPVSLSGATSPATLALHNA